MDNKDLNEEIDENTAVKEALQCEIGAKLQQAREAKKLSPDFFIKELKFSKTFLDALESGEWDKMPGEVYALGFLKQYAALLGLDVSPETERIKNKSFELTTPLTYPDAPISPNRKWVAIAVVLFAVVMIAFNVSDDQDDTPTMASMNNEQNQEKHVDITVNDKSSVTQDEYTKSNIESNVETVPRSTSQTTLIAPQPMKKTYSFYAATNDVWLQVYEIISDSKTKLLREVLLKKGQSFSVIDTTAKLELTAGNARSLEILEGNKVLFAAGSLGEKGKVLKHFLINSDI
jgi:cytoskeletal protein RodZ